MKITIIHPTRGRKQQALATCAKWLRYADRPDQIEYIFSVDTSDMDQWYYTVSLMPHAESNYIMDVLFFKNDNKTAIEAINFAAKYATTDLFVVVSDDFDCPEHWDTLLLEAVKGKSDFLLKTDDGNQPTCVTLPILDRAYYERFCYIYNPGYLHMWSDTEMTAIAIMTGRFIKSDLKFQHMHYSFGKGVKDAINDRNNATWQQGERLFNERLKSNFGIENPVIPYSKIQWK